MRWPDGVVLAQERYIDRLKRALDERTRRLGVAEELLLMCDQALYEREGWEEGPTENEFRAKLSGWVVTKETEEQIDAEDEL